MDNLGTLQEADVPHAQVNCYNTCKIVIDVQQQQLNVDMK